MVFGGQISFSIPQFFFGPQKFVSGGFFFLGAPKNRRFSAPKTKNRLFDGRLRSKGLYTARTERPVHTARAAEVQNQTVISNLLGNDQSSQLLTIL